MWQRRALERTYHLSRNGTAAKETEYLQDRDVAAISGACFAMPASLWKGIGGFDDGFFLYLEDTELSLRLGLAGYRCRYISAAIVYHDYQGTFPAAKHYYLERNRLLMMFGTFSQRSLLALFPALLCVEVLVWAYTFWKGPAWASAKASSYAWLWRNRKSIGHKRRRMELKIHPLGEGRVLSHLGSRLELGQLSSAGFATAISIATIPLFGISGFVARVVDAIGSARAPSHEDKFVVGEY